MRGAELDESFANTVRKAFFRYSAFQIFSFLDIRFEYELLRNIFQQISFLLFRICSLILLLDMTNLDEMWITIEKTVDSVRRLVENLERQDINLQTRLAEKMRLRLEKYDDGSLKMCNPCPIPVTIVASKYDEFQNFESEKRRHLCQFLRFLAYSYGANLMMFSSRMEQFPKLVKNMTSHFAFGTVCPQGYMTDHNKPMFVKCGFDSLEVSVRIDFNQHNLPTYIPHFLPTQFKTVNSYKFFFFVYINWQHFLFAF